MWADGWYFTGFCLRTFLSIRDMKTLISNIFSYYIKLYTVIIIIRTHQCNLKYLRVSVLFLYYLEYFIK